MTAKKKFRLTSKFKKFYAVWSLTGNALLAIFFVLMLVELIFEIITSCNSESPSSCGSSQFVGTFSSAFIVLPLICFLALTIFSFLLLRHRSNPRKTLRLIAGILALSIPFAFFPLSVTKIILSAIINGNLDVGNIHPSIDTLLDIGDVVIHLYFISLIILSIIYNKKLSK